MMQDQHSKILNNFYNKAIEKAKVHLERKYNLTVCNQKDDEIAEIAKNIPSSCRPCSNYWKIEVNGSIRNFSLIIAIPDRFPDYFPKIYLSQKDYNEIAPIPHLENNRAVCTRNDDIAALNDQCPDEAIEKLIEIAIGIIECGIKKENVGEYLEEYLAYWNEKIEHCSLSLFTPSNKPEYLKLFKLSKHIFGLGLDNIITDSEEHLEKWLKPFDTKITEKIIDALYLPVENYLHLSVSKNIEILGFFKEAVQKDYLKNIQDYFSRNLPFYILICAKSLGKERVIFGWKLDGWQRINIRGFSRKRNIPLDYLLSYHKLKDRLIKRIKLIRLDRDHLFRRMSL